MPKLKFHRSLNNLWIFAVSSPSAEAKALSAKLEDSKYMHPSITSLASVLSFYSIKHSESVEILNPATAEDVNKIFLISFMILNQENSLIRGTKNTSMCSR